MATEWFTKGPNEPLIKEEPDGSAIQIVGDDTPDWVRLPPEFGGRQVKVVRTFTAPCPVHKTPCRHYELEGGYFVAESDQFYWYRRDRHVEGKG